MLNHIVLPQRSAELECRVTPLLVAHACILAIMAIVAWSIASQQASRLATPVLKTSVEYQCLVVNHNSWATVVHSHKRLAMNVLQGGERYAYFAPVD